MVSETIADDKPLSATEALNNSVEIAVDKPLSEVEALLVSVEIAVDNPLSEVEALNDSVEIAVDKPLSATEALVTSFVILVNILSTTLASPLRADAISPKESRLISAPFNNLDVAESIYD